MINSGFIRFRLTAWYAGVLAGILILFSIAIYAGVSHFLRRNLHESVVKDTLEVASIVQENANERDEGAIGREVGEHFSSESNDRAVRALGQDGTQFYLSGPGETLPPWRGTQGGVGSGLAIVPFLHGGVVQEHHWLTETQFLDAVAVAMITPGPVVITVAFIGYLVSGITGACAAALGVVLPVYLFVVVLGPFNKRFSQNVQVRSFVQGVTAAATGAIAGAVIVLAKHSIQDYWTVGIAVATFLILLKWKIPEPIIIVVAGLLGVVIRLR